ncbi:mechanosensitive ion channel family protein [Allosaccharopolyspora coralli]|uniref:mechanosensitive ion channel family protein n=1 Tax=Allosaccharopolyspora coralli TaxID=2665642 RepID=UPI001E3530EA|nr:hypothetical protein [Allosaccharopolyspora coralli]
MGALQQGLTQALTAVATFVPKLLMFLILLLIGWLVAKAVSKAVELLFKKLNFSRLVEKSGMGSLTQGTQFDVGGLLVKLVYYFILLIFLQLALGVFGPNAVSDLISQVVAYLPRILVAVVLVLVAAAIGRAVADIVRSSLGDRPVGPLLANIVFGFIVALGIIAALNQMGIGLTVTTPVLVTILATVGGVIVVGVGGGLIRPMQERWGRWLTDMEGQFSNSRSGGAPTGQHSAGGSTQGAEGSKGPQQ